VPLLLQLLFWYFIIIHMLPPPRASLALLDTVFLNNRGLYLPAPADMGASRFLLFAAALPTLVSLIAPPFRKYLGKALALSAVFVLLTLSAATWSRPALAGFNFAGGTSLNPEFVAIVFALSVYAAAPIGEVVRVGIISVSGGQSEAARTLGFSYLQTVRLVVVPQALRVIILPLGNQYLHLIRNTSLGAAIGFPELMSVFGGTVLNQSGRAIEIVFIMMLTYLGIGLAAGWVMSRLNDSFQIPGRTA
jgi:general L-amino acid transport system permease protein